MTSATGYQQHIHVFRGVAIILIVCAHTVPSLNWSDSPQLGRLIDAIANQTSIFFFFIAGYLFQYLSPRFTYKAYLLQKFKTVILPYLLLSIPALIIFTVLTQRTGMWPWFYALPIWQQLGLFIITGKHLAPLWFVPTITLFYIAAPLLLWIDRQARAGYWIIVPLLLLAIYTGRSGQFGPLNFALYLLPVYLLGMVCARYKDFCMELVGRWWWMLGLLAVLSIAGFILQWSEPPHLQMPMKVALALLITWSLYRYHHWFGSRLDYIAEVSFGIFFVHAYFISFIKVVTVYLLTGALYKGQDGDVIPGNLLVFLAYAGAVLLLSVLSLMLAKKILGRRSRMFVGA